MARASSAGSVIRDEPGRADILLGNSLHCEAKQKNEQENQTFFHDCLTVKVCLQLACLNVFIAAF